MDQIDMKKMRKELIDDEGLRTRGYQDSLGYLSIGVGRLIDPRRSGGLSVAECMTLLDNDISSALKDCATLPYWPDLNDTRRRALCNMRFELGFEGLLSFATFLDLMRQGRYKEAGEDLRGTKWAKQVPARANRVIRMIIEG